MACSQDNLVLPPSGLEAHWGATEHLDGHYSFAVPL